MWFRLMAFEWCNAAPWPWCNCNRQMLTLNQGKLCFGAIKSLFMTDDLPRCCGIAPRRRHYRLVCRWNCYDKRFGATNFGWNNIVPLHNSTLSNVDIKQMWCLVLALSRLSKWTGDVKISGDFSPCRIHNWLWLTVEFATVECRR
jgi:hypothetical protein